MAKEVHTSYKERLQKAASALWDNLVELAQRNGYEKEIVANRPAWQKTINEIANGLIRYIEESVKSSFDTSGYQHIAKSLPVRIGESVANNHRKNGVKFEHFLVLTKLCRRIFVALFEQPGPPLAETADGIKLVHDFFDLFDIGASAEWQQHDAAHYQKKLREAQHLNLQERRRYATIFYKMAEPAFVVDSNLCLLDVNSAFEDFFGGSGVKLAGKPCASFLGHDAYAICVLEQALKEHSSFSNIELSITVAGSEKKVLMSGTSLGYVSGEFPGGIVILQDVTERERIKRALQESEAKYRSMVENAPDVTWRADEDGRLLFISPNVVKMCGYLPEELYQVNRHAYIHPDDAEEVWEAYGKLFTEHRNYDVRYRLKTKDGDWVWLHDRATTVYEREDGKFADGMFSDITELQEVEEELEEYRSWLEDLVDERTEELFLSNEKLVQEIVERQQADEELRQLTESLKRSNTELEQFAHVASHDMKEPLMLIGAFSERLFTKYNELLDDKGREYLQRILRSVRKLQQLIDDLLELSRIRTCSKQLEVIDLSELMNEIVQDLEECINNVGGRVAIGPLGALEGDRVQIRQLFQNIIINAMKYRKDTETPKVIITGRSIGEDIYEISVEDNGIGIAEKDLTRIFRPFERLHSGDKYEGTGIGLTTCERIVRRHGGTIIAKSILGEGTTFLVRLPRCQTENGADNNGP